MPYGGLSYRWFMPFQFYRADWHAPDLFRARVREMTTSAAVRWQILRNRSRRLRKRVEV